MNAWEVLLRRARATTRLEKAAGGTTQATWAIEAAAGYLERGGTHDTLLWLLGQDTDHEIQQLLGEDPGVTAQDLTYGIQPPPAVTGGYNLLPAYQDHPEYLDHAREYRILDYGSYLSDDEDQAGRYFDRHLPQYLIRVTDVHETLAKGRNASRELHACVAERTDLE